jgi:hypothetical protein
MLSGALVALEYGAVPLIRHLVAGVIAAPFRRSLAQIAGLRTTQEARAHCG